MDLVGQLETVTTPTPTVGSTVGTSIDTTVTAITTGIQNYTHFLIVLYIFASHINLVTLVDISNTYRPRATIVIIFIDAWVSTLSIVPGLILVLSSSISERPNGYVCTFASFAAMVSFGCPILSCLFLAYIG